MRRLVSWLPPLGWMAVILWLSSGDWSAAETGGTLLPLLRWFLPWATPVDLDLLHALARKGGHLTEYGVLAVLWRRALTRETSLTPHRATAAAFAVAVAWAIVDEIHQATVPSRTGSPIDVMIDTAGAAAALTMIASGWRRALDAATTTLLWLAAIGGSAALALNWLASVESRALWFTAPAAAVLIAVRHFNRRRHAYDRVEHQR